MLFGNFATRRIATPTQMRLGNEAATKALVGIYLDLRNARVDLAVRPFVLDAAAAVTLVKLERKPRPRGRAEAFGPRLAR